MENRVKLVILALVLGSVSGCAKYKSSWSCQHPQGIGCSSIAYADQIARKHIILDEDKEIDDLSSDRQKRVSKRKNKKPIIGGKILIKEHYSDFKRFDTMEVEID
jgi:hypothetical protein